MISKTAQRTNLVAEFTSIQRALLFALMSALKCAVAAVVVSVIFIASMNASAQAPLEFTPYRIEVFLAMDDDAQFSAGERARLHTSVESLAHAQVGAAWTVSVREAKGKLRGDLLTRFHRLDAENLIAQLDDGARDGDNSPHKLMFFLLNSDRGRWSIAARELDVRTFHLSPAVSRKDVARPMLPTEIVQAMVDVFSPLAKLGTADGAVVVGHLQAGSLVMSEDSPAILKIGDPLVPILRRNDRLGRATPRDVVVLPWTVLEARSLEGSQVTCQVHTAHQNPLGRRSRLRIERFGLATRYRPAPTRLLLQTPGDDPAPLAGYELVRLNSEEGNVEPLARTDAAGRASLPASDDPFEILFVRHGDRILARLPMVAGWSDFYSVALPSDDVRLAAEGFIAALRQQVVDTVARRQLLATRIRNRIAQGRFGDAESLLEEFRQLESGREFHRRLGDARAELVADNARAQQLIDEMFAETRQVIDRYLDPDEASVLARQLSSAKSES